MHAVLSFLQAQTYHKKDILFIQSFLFLKINSNTLNIAKDVVNANHLVASVRIVKYPEIYNDENNVLKITYSYI